MMGLYSVLLVVFGYLLGSIPTAYLAGRWIKGIDLRKHGSGTVSGSMVWEHVAKWAIFPVGIFDLLKGAIPVWIGLGVGVEDWIGVTAGLAALSGHNWPVYLGFTGGRGLSPFMGLMIAVFPWGFPWILAFLAIGYLLKDSAPWALVSLLFLPLFNHWVEGPPVVYWASLLMVLLTIVKRLEANRRPLPTAQEERRVVLLRRLFFDRDIASHQDWINQQSP